MTSRFSILQGGPSSFASPLPSPAPAEREVQRSRFLRKSTAGPFSATQDATMPFAVAPASSSSSSSSAAAASSSSSLHYGRLLFSDALDDAGSSLSGSAFRGEQQQHAISKSFPFHSDTPAARPSSSFPSSTSLAGSLSSSSSPPPPLPPPLSLSSSLASTPMNTSSRSAASATSSAGFPSLTSSSIYDTEYSKDDQQPQQQSIAHPPSATASDVVQKFHDIVAAQFTQKSADSILNVKAILRAYEEACKDTIKLTKAKAISSFSINEADTLSFDAGDVIELIDTEDLVWWTGECRGFVGRFPKNCVEPIFDMASLLAQRDRLQPYSADSVAISQRLAWTRAERSAWNLLHLLFLDSELTQECSVASGANTHWMLQAKRDLLDEYLAHAGVSHESILRTLFLTDALARRNLLVLHWLESMALDERQSDQAALLYKLKHDATQTDGWEYTLHFLKHRAKAATPNNPIVTCLDPDAPVRESERKLVAEDIQREAQVLELVRTLIRGGRLSEAQELCRESGYFWRAATLGNPSLWTDASLVLTLYDPSPVTHSMVSTTRAVWMNACKFAARNSRLSRTERAIYASLVGDVPNMLSETSTWEDYVWAHFKSLVVERVELEYDSFISLSSLDPNGNPFRSVLDDVEDAMVDTQVPTLSSLERSAVSQERPKARPNAQRKELTPVSVVVALHPSNEKAGDELHFKQGDFISVLYQDLDDWWYGQANGQRGWFAASCCVPRSVSATRNFFGSLRLLATPQMAETLADPFHDALKHIILNDTDGLIDALTHACFGTSKADSSKLAPKVLDRILASLAPPKEADSTDRQLARMGDSRTTSARNPLQSVHILRFAVHVGLYLRSLKIFESDADADSSANTEFLGVVDLLLASYVEFLVETHRFDLVAAYVACISNLDWQVRLYAAFLQPFPSNYRHNYLMRGDACGLDVARIAKLVVDNIRAVADATDSKSEGAASSLNESFAAASSGHASSAAAAAASPSAVSSKKRRSVSRMYAASAADTSFALAPSTPKTPVQLKSSVWKAAASASRDTTLTQTPARHTSATPARELTVLSMDTSASSPLPGAQTDLPVKRLTTPRKPTLATPKSQLARLPHQDARDVSLANKKVVSRPDEDRIEAIRWLATDQQQLDEVLFQTNSVLRGFLASDKFSASEKLLETVAELPWSHLETGLPHLGEDDVKRVENCFHELRCLQSLVKAHKDYAKWEALNKEKPVSPPDFTTELYTNRAQHEASMESYKMRKERWQQELLAACETAVDSIREVLMFPKGWLVDMFPSEDQQRDEQLEVLRRKFLPALSFLLHKVLHDSEQYALAMQVADVVCHRPSELYALFSEPELHRLLSLLQETALKNMEISGVSLGFY